MQTYPLVLTAAAPNVCFMAAADFFVFESGSSSGDSHIVVKPSSGTEIVLKPGQRFRMPPMPQGDGVTQWFVRSLDGVSTINGKIIIGSGEFDDCNANNFVTIAASQVLNSAALPVQKQAWSTLTNFAPVAITSEAAQLLVSDATQRALKIRNTHVSANLYIGGIGVTLSNAAIVVSPGAIWAEDEAAGAAWYALSDGATITVAMLGMKL